VDDHTSQTLTYVQAITKLGFVLEIDCRWDFQYDTASTSALCYVLDLPMHLADSFES